MVNIEIKYQLNSLNEVRRYLSGDSHIQYRWKHRQEDVYFRVPRGRLKLRRYDNGKSELIYYRREDQEKPRDSQYHLLTIPQPDAALTLFQQALGVLAVVRKQRELWMFRNVRIHLDWVEHLGEFLELESVVDEKTDHATASRNLEEIQKRLETRFHLVPQPKGYLELLLERNSLPLSPHQSKEENGQF